MKKRHIYLRGGVGLPSITEQKVRLAEARVEAAGSVRGGVFLDEAPKKRRAPEATPLPELDKAISAAGPGDELWISHPCVFGTGDADVRLRLARITARQAVLRVASTGGRYVWHPDAEHGLRLAGEIADDILRWRTAPGRARAAEKTAAERARRGEAWDRLKEIWPASAGYSIEQIEALTGIKRRTAYNAAKKGELPPRGARRSKAGGKGRRSEAGMGGG